MALKCLGYVAPRIRSEDLKAEDAIFFPSLDLFSHWTSRKGNVRKSAKIGSLSSLTTSFESTKPKATKYEKETDMNSQVHRC